jgi:glycosyltransferase involved in cell wall biosynthesis
MNHIAFVLPGIDRLGGAERQAILLAKGLTRRGWRVSLVALSGNGGEAAAELQRAGVAFTTLRMRKGLADPRGWIQFRRWLKTQTPDVLHTHLPHAAWIARVSRFLAPVRVLVDTVHTTRTGSRLQRAVYRVTDSLSNRVTAVSRAVAEASTSAGIARTGQMLVLPNGIDVEACRPDPAVRARVRSELGLTTEFLWCAVGRLEPVKDYPTLLQAIAGLPEHARMVIAGGGWQESQLRSLASDLGLAHRVRFLGFQQDVRPWIQAADAMVLSSLWEGLPMSLLEAGACGLPCVATDVPGTNEIVIEGQTGFMAKPGSLDSLHGAMLRLMRMSPAERRSMGLNARRQVVEYFSLDAVIDRWETLFRDLLKQNECACRFPQRQGVLSGVSSPESSAVNARVQWP